MGRGERELATRWRRSSARAAATSTRSARATARTSASAAGAARAPRCTPLFRLQNVSTRTPRPDQLRRGGAPAPGLRAPDRPSASPNRARQPSLPRPRRFVKDGAVARELDLRPRGHALAHQPGLAPAQGQGPARLRARHRARLLGQERQDPDDDEPGPQRRAHERVIPYVEDRRNCLLFEPASELEPEDHGLAPGGAQERDPGALPARGQRAGGRAAPEPRQPPPDPVLRGGRGRRRRAAPPARRPRRAGRGGARGARALPLRPGDRRRPAPRPEAPRRTARRPATTA